MTANEFGFILVNPTTATIITERVDELKNVLGRRGQGVALATCPTHGEHMVLRKKANHAGLLDAFFLACPYWSPPNGCPFIDKLKSGLQLAGIAQVRDRARHSVKRFALADH